MNDEKYKLPKEENPLSIEEMTNNIRSKSEDIINFCTKNEGDTTFYQIEQSLRTQLYELACLFLQLCLMSYQKKFDYSKWLEGGLYNKGKIIPRTIKTMFGKVRYWRTYMICKNGGGFYPLDAFIGLTGDGFSPLVISLATKLATRVSFSTSVLIFRCFYGWSPSSEAIQHLILGMGRDSVAYMEQAEAPSDEGDVLVIEVDGKATPTARDEELEKRRGKRQEKTLKGTCPRHRGKNKRLCRCKKKRRKKGDKSKNGRSITLVVMYTLKRGEDGRLHGPINKKVWGSYA